MRSWEHWCAVVRYDTIARQMSIFEGGASSAENDDKVCEKEGGNFTYTLVSFAQMNNILFETTATQLGAFSLV